MAKQAKRPTHKQKIEAAKLAKIEASRLAKIEETKALKKQVASLDDRVSKLENEDLDGLAYQRQNAPLRPSRDFIGQKKEQAE